MGHIKNFVNWLTGNVPTNMGYVTLTADTRTKEGNLIPKGTYVTFLQSATGAKVIQTPTTYFKQTLP